MRQNESKSQDHVLLRAGAAECSKKPPWSSGCFASATELGHPRSRRTLHRRVSRPECWSRSIDAESLVTLPATICPPGACHAPVSTTWVKRRGNCGSALDGSRKPYQTFAGNFHRNVAFGTWHDEFPPRQWQLTETIAPLASASRTEQFIVHISAVARHARRARTLL